MRFDLEIPQHNIDICLISDGEAIPNIASPLYYLSINDDNKIPADYITADTSYNNLYSSSGYEVKIGPYLDNIRSSSFLITNVSKFSFENNTKIPLFYRHFIPHVVKEDAIIISDYYGISISRDSYSIEYDNSGTYIYMNKTDNMLFVSYIINNTTNKVLLNLNKVFTEATWSDISTSRVLPKYKYIYRDGSIDTSYNGDLYISYANDTELFRKPLGNMDDPWFIGILNFSTTQGDNIYKIPEYYLQQINSDGRYKYIEYKKCIKIFDRYVKSQYNIFDTYFDDVNIYIRDNTSDVIRHAFTTDAAKVGTEYQNGIFYGEIKNYNNDGIIEIPVPLEETDIVYASHYTEEKYYEYSLLDFNSLDINDGTYYAIYIKPNVGDGRSVFHAKIGMLTEDEDNIGFKTFADYEDYIQYNSYYHVVTVGLSFSDEDSSLLDIRDLEEVEVNNKDISSMSIDMLYSDIIKGNINIPTNDAVLVSLDLRRIQDDGKINLDTDRRMNDDSLEYIHVLEKNISRTLNASTKPIYEVIIKE